MHGWKRGPIVALLAGLIAGHAESPGQEPGAGRGRKYALLVGVRQYRPDTLRSLEYTEDDVTELAAVLERSGYRREDITILTQTLGARDARLLPLGPNIRAQLGLPDRPGRPFGRGLKLGPLAEDDTLLVAFAGHGVQFDPTGEGYFCPMDAELSDEKTLIRLSDVSRALDGCQAGVKLLLVDACRNNPQILANRAGERPVVDSPSLSRQFPKIKAGGTMALFSCSPGQVAFEDPQVKHGIFFHSVLRGLNGDPGFDGRVADANGDGKVDANELTSFADRNVFAHAGRLYSREQTVEVVNRLRGSVAIVDRGPVVGLAPEGTKAGDVRDDNALKMKFRWCPAGQFRMGSPPGEVERDKDEGPVEVTLSRGFWVGQFEVTQAQWQAVMGTSLREHMTMAGKHDVRGEGGENPIYYVSHEEATKFCRRFGDAERRAGRLPAGWTYTLPTEAQWEYACRAGTTTATAFGDRLSSREANCDGKYPYNGAEKGPYLSKTTPVGSYRPNAWGLFDMHGNVWEWCSDYYEANLAGGVEPRGPLPASGVVLRGGCWYYLPRVCRSAERGSEPPGLRSYEVGFRLARVQSAR